MATTNKAAKPTVTKITKQKPKTRTKAKPRAKPRAKAKPAAKPAKTEVKAPAKPTTTVVTKSKPKTSSAKPAAKPATKSTAKAPVKIQVEKKKVFKGTVYHVSKRENNGREWKVFIEKSTKPIKIFDTQAEALDFAKGLAQNKVDGSYVILHGLDGKIRKF